MPYSGLSIACRRIPTPLLDPQPASERAQNTSHEHRRGSDAPQSYTTCNSRWREHTDPRRLDCHPDAPCSFRNESDRINLFFIERYCAKDAVLTSPLGCGGARFHGPGKREKKQPRPTVQDPPESRFPTATRSAWRSAICRKPGRKHATTESTAIVWRRRVFSRRLPRSLPLMVKRRRPNSLTD